MEISHSYSFEKEKNIIKNAETLKKEGNDAYRNKDYRKAIGKYHRAMLQLKGVGGDKKFAEELLFSNMTGEAETKYPAKGLPPELKQEKNQLLSECYNNLAACLLAKEGDKNYERVVQYCESALELDPSNVKAIFRLGKAYFSIGKLEKAIDVLTSKPEYKTVSQIQELLHAVREKDKMLTASLKTTYQRMFSPKLSGGPERVEGQSEAAQDQREISVVDLETASKPDAPDVRVDTSMAGMVVAESASDIQEGGH